MNGKSRVKPSLATIMSARRRNSSWDRSGPAAEHALSELREAQRIARIGSWSWESGAQSVTWSDEMYRLFGRDAADGPATGEEFFAYVHQDDRDRVAATFRGAFETASNLELDFRIVRHQRDVVVLHALGHQDPGRAGRYVGTVQDVTELRATERALRSAEESARRQSETLSALIDNAPIGEAVVAPDGTFLRVNRALCEIVGYSNPELLALTFQDITHPDDLEADLEQVRQVLAGEIDTYQMLKRYIRKDGETVWIKLSVSLVRDGRDAPLYFISQIEDITEARTIQQELMRSEVRLRAIIDNTPAAIALRDLDGRYEHVNAYVEQSLGVDRAQLIGSSAAEHYPPELISEMGEQDRRVIEAGTPLTEELTVPHADGSERTFHVVNYPVRAPDGSLVGLGSFSLDITERKQVEQLLRERERELAEAQALAQFGSWELDLTSDSMRCTDELCKMFGWPIGSRPTTAEFLALIHPDDRKAVIADVEKARASSFGESEYRIIRPDGEIRYVHTRRYGRSDPEGRLTHLWGTTQDITDRKQAERDLQQAYEYSDAIIAAMREGYGLTVDGRITAVNNALCELTGFSRDELIGSGPPFPFWPPESVDETEKLRRRIVANEGGTFELTLMRKDGTRFDAEITAQAARNPDGTRLGFVNTFRDISERKRHQAELERLATSDSLTGLANRRVFDEQLKAEVARARRHGRPLSVVILDVDHFKRINDEHGHSVGDTVLRELATRLQSLVREGELLARVGGEEFAWLLPDAEGVGAFSAAERARRAVGDVPLANAGKVTLSAGVCDLSEAGDVWELYEHADQALYWAKQHGRNQSFRYSAEIADQLAPLRFGARG